VLPSVFGTIVGPDLFVTNTTQRVYAYYLDGADPLSYTIGMKTAISLPERVFKEAERFARRLKKTRSQLYAEVIAEYLARHAPNDITESMNQICDHLGTSNDGFQTKAARKLLSKETW
jgi:hypothetical protein